MTRGRLPTPRSQSTPTSKPRDPNYIGDEMLILDGQKRMEWHERHHSDLSTLVKFIYGTTIWNKVLVGYMGVVNFKVRDVDQVTNK